MAPTTTLGTSPLLDLLFEERTAARCLVAPDGSVLRVNEHWQQLTGLGLEEALGADVAALEPDGRDAALARHAAARAGGRVALPRRLHTVAGREAWWEGTLDPVPLDGGTGLLLTLREATGLAGGEASATTAASLEVLARLRSIADHAPVAVFVRRADGPYLFVNRCLRALLGLRTADPAAVPADLLTERPPRAPGRRAGGSDAASEEILRTPGGERVLMVVRFPFPVGDGSAGTFGIGVDVTERRRAEAALRTAEERYRTLFTSMTEGFALGEAICDASGTPRDFRFLEMNDAFEAQAGLSRAAVQGRPMREVLPNLEQSWVDTYCGVALGAAPRRFESYNRDLDRYFSVYCFSPAAGRFAIIFTDVTDRHRAEQAVREANAQLRDADRRKDEFLGMLSHELRNPLAPIRNALYILARVEPGGGQARRAQEIATRQVAHLTRLVDDLLDVTRIARGKIELRRADLDLAALARRAAEDHRPLMLDRGLTLDVETPPEPLRVNGDETRLAQVLGNLLSNAEKFTPPGGKVTLSVAAEGSRAVVHVRDTGAGIEAGMVHSIFEPFTQAKQTLARSEGGLGLGLALVKGLVALHGGEVSVASNGPSAGSDFAVSLPLVAARPDAVDGGRPAAAPARRRRVLVVDDNEDAAETLAQLVVMMGHEAEVAFDGASAVALAEAHRPDLVLCDLGLPAMDGYEVARRLRAGPARGARLVAVSGYAQPEDVARALEAGFDAHVPKPADPERLAQLLD